MQKCLKLNLMTSFLCNNISICTTGVWNSPTSTGERPPPCAHFTLTSIDDRRAVLFGGFNGDQGDMMNDVYIIDLQNMVGTLGP